jgi:hypothetical protein
VSGLSSSLEATAFFRQGDNVPSLLHRLSLFLVTRILSCLCNLNPNLFFCNFICKSDAGNFRVALWFDTICFALAPKLVLKFSLRVGYGSCFVFRCTLDTDKFDIIINIIGYVSIVLTDICRLFLRVSKVTEKIKTRSKPTPSENFNSHPL